MNKDMESQKRVILSQEKNEIVPLNIVDLIVDLDELEQQLINGGYARVNSPIQCSDYTHCGTYGP